MLGILGAIGLGIGVSQSPSNVASAPQNTSLKMGNDHFITEANSTMDSITALLSTTDAIVKSREEFLKLGSENLTLPLMDTDIQAQLQTQGDSLILYLVDVIEEGDRFVMASVKGHVQTVLMEGYTAIGAACIDKCPNEFEEKLQEIHDQIDVDDQLEMTVLAYAVLMKQHVVKALKAHAAFNGTVNQVHHAAIEEEKRLSAHKQRKSGHISTLTWGTKLEDVMQGSNVTMSIDQDLGTSRNIRKWAENMLSTLKDLSELRKLADKVIGLAKKTPSVDTGHEKVAEAPKKSQYMKAKQGTRI